MPTKKNTCDRVERGVAGQTAEDVMNLICTEYGLPRPARRKTKAPDAAKPPRTIKPSKVKP